MRVPFLLSKRFTRILENVEILYLLMHCDFLYTDSSFKEFFHHEDNLQLWDKFKIYHIDAPGQVSILDEFYFGSILIA